MGERKARELCERCISSGRQAPLMRGVLAALDEPDTQAYPDMLKERKLAHSDNSNSLCETGITIKKPLLTDEEKETDVCICGHTREVHTCENESVMTACEFAHQCDCGEFKLKPKPLLSDEEIDCWFEFWISELERVGAVAGAKRARDFYEKKKTEGKA